MNKRKKKFIQILLPTIFEMLLKKLSQDIIIN